MSKTSRPQITEPVLVKNPCGEGHINLTGFLNALLEYDDATQLTDLPDKLQSWKNEIKLNNEDILMNLDIEDIDKVTYQNILHRTSWTSRIADSIQIVHNLA